MIYGKYCLFDLTEFSPFCVWDRGLIPIDTFIFIIVILVGFLLLDRIKSQEKSKINFKFSFDYIIYYNIYCSKITKRWPNFIYLFL